MNRLSCLLCLLSLSISLSAQAKTVYVDQNAAGAVHDGASWSTAFLTVKSGILSAKAGDEIWVAEGVYTEIVYPGGDMPLYGGFAGTEMERGQRDWRAHPTVLDGGGSTTQKVVYCNYAGTVLDGFTIRNGLGGVYLSAGSATLANDSITGNSANGVYQMSTGTLTIQNSVISGNGGWGVFAYVGATANVANSTVCGNGGGLDISSTATLVNDTISGNSRGVFLDTDGRATIANTIIAFNGYGVSRTSNATIPTFVHNDVFGNAGGDYAGFTPTYGMGNLSADPELSNPFRNVHIQPGSPCVDAGQDAFVTGTTDIDGQPRIQGAHVDIGSDESDGTVWPASPIIWHVSPAGSDANDGRTWATAKKTVGGALSAVLGADEVWVAVGTYPERMTVPAGVALYGGFAGTETARSQRDWNANPTILDAGYAPDAKAVNCTLYAGVVDGFTIRNGSVNLAGAATLANNTISASTTDGVYVGDSATLTNNVISGNTGYGVNVAGTATLTGNTVSGNNMGVFVPYGGTATLASNVVTNNKSIGVFVYGPTTLVNNTITGNTDGVRVTSSGQAKLTNNILAFNTAYGLEQLSPSTISTFSHNDVYGNAQGDYSGFTPPAGQGNLSLDPLFIDRANGDLHLGAGSPCIDAGDDSVVAVGDTDRDGKPRRLGAHVDIGAYEAGAGYYTAADATKALKIAAGLLPASSDDLARLNVEPGTTGIDLLDALRLARKAAGLDANP